jgi:exoribonuclease-2
MLWCAIDNDDSLDLDQLTALEPLEAGKSRLLVAIADVDALVKRGSAISNHVHNKPRWPKRPRARTQACQAVL